MKLDKSFGLGVFAGMLFSLILVSCVLGMTWFALSQAPQAAPKQLEEFKGIKPEEPRLVKFSDLKGFPSAGPENAPVTLVEFGDFYCPFCRKVNATVNELLKNYPDKIRRVWRHFPLDMHEGARRVHEASECAAEQHKFWEYHDKLFQLPGSKDDSALSAIASEVGLNATQFGACLTSGKYKKRVEDDIEAGLEAGVQGTPAIFVNGELISGAAPYARFEKIIKNKLAQAE